MIVLNVIDDQKRFVGLKFDLTRDGSQEDSDTFSYLYLREQYEKDKGTKNIGLGERV